MNPLPIENCKGGKAITLEQTFTFFIRIKSLSQCYAVKDEF